MHRDEEIRPYWGESAEVLDGPIDPAPPRVETHTLAEWRELKIADGLCPLPGCAGNLDEDFFCSLCGNTSLPHQTVVDGPEPAELPFFPLVLHVPDEYAPAEVDAA